MARSLINYILWKSDFVVNSWNMSDGKLATLLRESRERLPKPRLPGITRVIADERNIRVLIQLPETLDKPGYRKIVVTKIMIDFVSKGRDIDTVATRVVVTRETQLSANRPSTSRHSTSQRSFSIARK